MVRFGKQKLGNGQPCFITFEAGATHNGEAAAKDLISHAAEAGANAVKFQIFDPDRLVQDKAQLFSYDILVDRKTGETRTITEPLYDILCRRYLTKEEWKRVKVFSDSLGLAFFATVGFEEDVLLLDDMGCDSIKIASADVNHWPLIRLAARTGMCVQLDTGSASLGEIDQAVTVCIEEGNSNVIIHNCPSGYPARLESINLKMIRTLKQMFPDLPIAYSDHTPGWDMDIAAVALGADLVEKTITLDRTQKSAEHLFSLEPHEMEPFVRAIRDIEIAMGSPVRRLHPEEVEKRTALRRSAFLKKEAMAGEVVSLDHVEFRRPGYGMSPKRFDSICGRKRFAKPLPLGHMIQTEDMEAV